jgi:two-component system, NtrC family, sensor kinase
MNADQTTSTPAGAPRATLLIVDDTPQNLVVLGELLMPFYRVRAVDSGERALVAAQTEPRPDLILLDVMMPGMDGTEVLRRLRAEPGTSDIPVVFVTALQDEADEQRGFELGAADYIHKPICGPIVLSRIRAQLDAKAARDMLKKNNQRLATQVSEGADALELAQHALLQSEKLAAMGQLAAGVAHEINNPIGFVGSNLGTLEGYLNDLFSIISAYEKVEATPGSDPGSFAEVRQLKQSLNYEFLKDDLRDLVAESKDGIARVRRIARDLKDFSRASNNDWEWSDIHAGIDSTLNIIWNELKYHCTVKKQYGPLPHIRCLPSQLNQVFMNLLVNAGHAIEERGEISITTECDGNDAVRIMIADTGKGIPPESLVRIFEPFYTTKPAGMGTGLGLSVVSDIIERHHGHIEVVSEVGRGTTFIITLPVEPPTDKSAEASS